MRSRYVFAISLTCLAACRSNAPETLDTTTRVGVTSFLADANAKLLKLGNELGQASWVRATYITDDTDAILARATESNVSASTDYAKRAAKYASSDGTLDEQRQLTVLRNVIVMAAPADANETKELSQISSRLKTTFATARWCPNGPSGDGCMARLDVANALGKTRDPRRARELWEGWHTVAPPMK